MPKLTIEMIPTTSFGNNVRKRFSKVIWDEIRNRVFKDAKFKCEICEGIGTSSFSCHESWNYNLQKEVQTLRKLQCLCDKCHRVKHIGHSNRMGYLSECIGWMKKINDWNERRLNCYVKETFEKWEERSLVKRWKLDLSYLNRRFPDLFSSELT